MRFISYLMVFCALFSSCQKKEDGSLHLRSYRVRSNGELVFTYTLTKDRFDEISVETARSLLMDELENLSAKYDRDSLHIYIYFEDKNRIELGQGVAVAHLTPGKITYKGYNIREYRKKFPAIGSYYLILEETR